jgi:hypothetical protein
MSQSLWIASKARSWLVACLIALLPNGGQARRNLRGNHPLQSQAKTVHVARGAERIIQQIESMAGIENIDLLRL